MTIIPACWKKKKFLSTESLQVHFILNITLSLQGDIFFQSWKIKLRNEVQKIHLEMGVNYLIEHNIGDKMQPCNHTLIQPN